MGRWPGFSHPDQRPITRLLSWTAKRASHAHTVAAARTLHGVRRASTGTTALGIVLIVVVGVLNFHPPHFLLEAGHFPSTAGSVALEASLLAGVVAALIAAVGIYRDARWGWLLGIVIAGIGAALYLVQETVGLPGLPRMWWEPSRIISLVIEAAFVVVAYRRLRRSAGRDHSLKLGEHHRQ